MRTNGLQTPYNAMQITTWILFPALIAQFCLFLTPNLSLQISLPLTVLFLICGLLSVTCGYSTCKTDSIDTMLYQHLNNRPHPRAVKKEGEEQGEEQAPKTKYCWVCQTDVYEASMHCKYCDKCVSTFDHHCMWLNNCVGDANYRQFYATVWYTFLFIAIHIGTLTVYLVLYFTGNEETKQRTENWLGVALPLVVVGVNIGFLVLTTFAGLLVAQLLFFHMSLRRQNITTYQFIVRDGQQKRDRAHFISKVSAKRDEIVLEAKTDGKCLQACWLGIGAKYCKVCDPVIPMVREEMDKEAAEKSKANDDKANDNEKSVKDEKKSETGEIYSC